MSSRVALVAAGLAAGLAPGCGDRSVPSEGAAPPQTIELNWRQKEGGTEFFLLTIRRLVIRRGGWSVAASVANQTQSSFAVGRPHVPGGTKFGLFHFRSGAYSEVEDLERRRLVTPPLLATMFVPPLPRVFQPGMRWVGRFSGQGAIPSGRFVRVAFGRLSTSGTPPAGFFRGMVFVSNRAVRVRG